MRNESIIAIDNAATILEEVASMLSMKNVRKQYRGCINMRKGDQFKTKWGDSYTGLKEMVLVIEYEMGLSAWVESRVY